MRRLWIALVFALAARAVPGWAQTIDDLIGRPVASVQFDVEGRPETSAALLSLVDVAVGKPLTLQDIRSSEDHLIAIGRYEDVTPVGVLAPGGVAITFRLVPRHPIERVEIAGEAGMPANDLKSQILQRYGGVPASQSREDIEATARQILHDEGYLQAAVQSSVVLQHAPEAAILTLTVNAGPLAHIHATEVRGAAVFTPDEVMKRTGTSPGQPYRPRAIETAVSTLEDDLRGRGYYEAQATVDAVPDGPDVDLRLNIDTGPRIELRVNPPGSLPGEIETLIPIQRERSADQDLLEDAKGRIENALHDQGYAEAHVAFTRELQQENTVLAVTFTIDRGPRYYVDHVEFPSSAVVPPAELRKLLPMAHGDVFSETQYLQGLARIIDAYLRAGYYTAESKPDRETLPDPRTPDRVWVVLHPNITEGPRASIAAIHLSFAGNHQVTEGEVRAAMRLQAGAPYVAVDVARDRDQIVALYHDRGFLNAAVQVAPAFSADGTTVTIAVTISEGPQVLIGDIMIVGNERVSESLIREELHLSPGQPLTDSARREAQRRLYDMGVFRRVSITVENRLAGESRANVIVSVTEAPATSLGFGGGLEVRRSTRGTVGGGIEDYLQLAPRGSFDIGRQNLGGRNRSIDLFSRLSLKPRVAPGNPAIDGRGFGFAEYRTALTYRERHAFQSDNDLLVGVTSEQAVRTTFNFVRHSANAELLHRVNDRVSLSGRYALDFTRLFDERFDQNQPDQGPIIDRLFPQVRLSIVAGTLVWDRRDNPLSPTSGTFITADVEAAARVIGSEVGYDKTFLQASDFYALDPRARTVLAMRAEIGLARGFPRLAPDVDAAGAPIVDENGQPVLKTVRDLPASQRFFAGGSTTVRGFQQDRLGVPEILDVHGLSSGGNGLIVVNAEVRRVVTKLFNRDLAGVVFMDGGNVFQNASDVTLDRIRGSAGFGVRWDSPLGPLRLDFGFKFRRATYGDGTLERPWEYHLSIGEAF
jgi:outer membrane protein insertion porin family